jgi:23S rRNA (guanosine2251-2'-O)-methyltransferase
MPAWDFDFTQRVCVVIGSEGEGVHRLVRERCDARVRLPVKGHIASLNASAAASALLYEVIRQRAGSPPGALSRELPTSGEVGASSA